MNYNSSDYFSASHWHFTTFNVRIDCALIINFKELLSFSHSLDLHVYKTIYIGNFCLHQCRICSKKMFFKISLHSNFRKTILRCLFWSLLKPLLRYNQSTRKFLRKIITNCLCLLLLIWLVRPGSTNKCGFRTTIPTPWFEPST